MKMTYKTPKMTVSVESNITAFPLLAPLAFVSVASAAGAAVGVAVGAVATKKLIRATPDEHQNLSLEPICQ